MGFWSGIKHAINSTLGTSEFQPLDKIIDGQRTLAASDSVLNVVFSGNETIGENYEIIGGFIPKKNGSVRVIIEYRNSSNTERTFYAHIIREEDNAVIAKNSLSIGYTQTNVLFVDVPIAAGVSYQIRLFSSNNTTYVTSVKIGAQIVDTSLVEVV